jgi:GNAT superfamily N-acetyltransferase
MINNSKNNYEISHIDGVITFKNKNTTIGFIRFNNNGEVEYIFVNPAFRKQGMAKKLLKLTKEKLGKDLVPQDPISPLGKKLFIIA